MKQEIHICFASDDNYAPYMGLAILSILQSAAKEDSFHFYILDNKISTKNKTKLDSLHAQYTFQLDYIELDEKMFARCDARRAGWTLSIFGRYLIPKVISADKVLYLDCDVMVRGSLQELWRTDLTAYYLAGVPDYNVIFRGKLSERFGTDFKKEEYVNSGVLLMNNKKWREENLFEKLMEFSEKNASSLLWPDQDTINVICQKHKKILPERYNIMGFMYKPDLFEHLPSVVARVKEEIKRPVVRHFHAWKKNFFMLHRDEYLQLMRQSPWKELIPQDDPKIIAWTKIIAGYCWRHPFCFLLPKFYKRWMKRGSQNLFIEY